MLRIPVHVTVIAVRVFKNHSIKMEPYYMLYALATLPLRSVVVTNNTADKYVMQFDCDMHLEI